MPKKSTQDLMVFQVTPELRGRLESEAVRTGLSVSAVIRLRLSASFGMTDGAVASQSFRVTGVGEGLNFRVVADPAAAREVKRKKVRVLK